MEIRPAQAAQLRIQIGEQAALQQRVVAEVDAGHDVARAVGNLFGFGKEVVRPAVEHHAADDLQRHQLFGNDLGRIQMVERECIRLGLGEQLHAKFPFREVAVLDRLEQITAVEVLIGAGNLDRLVPDGRLQAQLGTPMEFDEGAFAFVIEETEAVDAEPFDHAQRARDGAVAHRPHDHVHRFGVSEMKSQNVSCALAACGKPRSGSIFTAWIRSGNLIASWMKTPGYCCPPDPNCLPWYRTSRQTAHIARRVHRAGAARNGRKTGK